MLKAIQLFCFESAKY